MVGYSEQVYSINYKRKKQHNAPRKSKTGAQSAFQRVLEAPNKPRSARQKTLVFSVCCGLRNRVIVHPVVSGSAPLRE